MCSKVYLHYLHRCLILPVIYRTTNAGVIFANKRRPSVTVTWPMSRTMTGGTSTESSTACQRGTSMDRWALAAMMSSASASSGSHLPPPPLPPPPAPLLPLGSPCLPPGPYVHRMLGWRLGWKWFCDIGSRRKYLIEEAMFWWHLVDCLHWHTANDTLNSVVIICILPSAVITFSWLSSLARCQWFLYSQCADYSVLVTQ